ncbi:hypothetical protein ACOSQ2_026534 [Xanthoceras sorbifolium]
MWLPRNQKGPQTLGMMIIILLIISSFTIQASATLSKKLDQEQLLVPPPDYNYNGIKCGTCPCVNPCGQLPPPPPSPPPPPPPPPPPKTPSCPQQQQLPPPPPRFIYVTGVPGEIYQTEVDNWGFFSRSAECNVAKKLLLLAGYFVLGILVIW